MRKITIEYTQYGYHGESTVFESNARLHGITFEEELQDRINALIDDGAEIIKVR